MDAPSTPPVLAASQPPKLLDSLRQCIRVLRYSIRTEQAYVDWARRFILFHGKRHPREMGAPEVTAFLTHLAVARNVSASTQNQAKAAILFLYKEVLQQDLPWLPDALAVKYPNAATAWGWQYVFPSAVRSVDPRSGVERRHHLLEQSVPGRALRGHRPGPARRMCCGIPSPPICCKRVTTSVPCRNCWATRM